MSTEFQNAFAVSRINHANRTSGTRKLIADAIAAGKFVAVITYPAYCPITDGSMGGIDHIVKIADTYAEAREALDAMDIDEDCNCSVKCNHAA